MEREMIGIFKKSELLEKYDELKTIREEQRQSKGYYYITGKIEMIEEIMGFKIIEEIVVNKRRRN